MKSRGQSCSEVWEDLTEINGMRARVSWFPRSGLKLHVGEAGYHAAVPRELFHHGDDGNVSWLDVRRARESLIAAAERQLMEPYAV